MEPNNSIKNNILENATELKEITTSNSNNNSNRNSGSSSESLCNHEQYLDTDCHNNNNNGESPMNIDKHNTKENDNKNNNNNSSSSNSSGSSGGSEDELEDDLHQPMQSILNHSSSLNHVNSYGLNNSNDYGNDSNYNIDPSYDIDPVLKQQIMEEDIIQMEINDTPIVDHLIFIVHGMGNQVNNEKTINHLEQNVNCLKKNFNLLQKDKSQQLQVEFRCIEWHSKIRKGTLNEDLEKIKPEKVEKIRGFINDTLFDIMLYMTPEYHKEIMNEVSSQINQTYQIFMNFHPKFRGLVSIFCHSLGSVIVWDILTKKLVNFKIENVYGIGSPLGIFLRLNGFELGKLDFNEMIPQVNNWYNLYSSTDPVAYRIEPFIDIRYLKLKPMPIERMELDKIYKDIKLHQSNNNIQNNNVNNQQPIQNIINNNIINNPQPIQNENIQIKENNEQSNVNIQNNEQQTNNNTVFTSYKEKFNGFISNWKNKKQTTTTISSTTSTTTTSTSTTTELNTKPQEEQQLDNQNNSEDNKMGDGNNQNYNNLKNKSKPIKSHPLEISPIVSDKTDSGDYFFNDSGTPTQLNSPPKNGINGQQSQQQPQPQQQIVPDNTDYLFEDKDIKRYDFVLEEGSNIWRNGLPSYIVSIFSHMSYWESKGIANFLVRSLAFNFHKLKQASDLKLKQVEMGFAQFISPKLNDVTNSIVNNNNNNNNVNNNTPQQQQQQQVPKSIFDKDAFFKDEL